MAKSRKTPVKGELMKVVNPVFVQRVGYPHTSNDYLAKAETELTAAKLISPKLKALYGPTTRNRYEEKLIRACALNMLDNARFGGPKRALHTIEYPAFKDAIVEVVDVKAAMTGTRYDGYARYDSWNNEWDCEFPGLSNQVHHNLVQIRNPKGGSDFEDFVNNLLVPMIHTKKRWSQTENDATLVIELTNLERWNHE